MTFNELSAKELSKKSGVYKLESGGHIYIGSSKNLYSRLTEHRRDLFNNVHTNQFLQNCINKNGIDNVNISILEFCDPEIRTEREKYWIEQTHSDLNFKDPVLNTLSDYSKKKLSESVRKGLKEGKYLHPTNRCKIFQYDVRGKFLREYDNIDKAAEETGYSKKEIQRCCGGYNKGSIHDGYRFRYEISKVEEKEFHFNDKFVGKYYDFYYINKNGKEEKAFNDCRDVWSFFGKLINEENPEQIIIIPKLKNLVNLGNPRTGNHNPSSIENIEKDQRLDKVAPASGVGGEISTSARQ